RALGTRTGRALAGFSMGGYGALHYAFKYPDLFASVAVHSASMDEDRASGFSTSGTPLSAFGVPFDKQYWRENTPQALARASSGFPNLKIYFDCGIQDPLALGAESLHEVLEEKKIPHEYHLYPGSHNWDYVEQHFGEMLTFQSRALGAK